MKTRSVVLTVPLLLAVWGFHFSTGQTGECPVVTSQLVPRTIYISVSEIYYTTCNWISTCSRTRYRRVSQVSSTVVYSSTFQCCAGYQQTSGNTCMPVCSNACQNGGTCSSPNTCTCPPQWTGDTCQTPICSSECMNGGTCSAPNTCSCPPQWTGSTCQTDVNECSSSTLNNCQQTCTNTPGTYTCGCNSGYTLDSNGNTCSDINECSSDTDNNCEQLCMNTDGSFTCGCNSGYTLHSNGYSCVDNNECTSGSHNCQQTCSNIAGTFTCGCNSGYTLESNGNTCSDINECSSDADNNCEQLCTNTDGSFTCGCNSGYTLHSNGYSCVDDNECTSGSHNCQQTCTNTPGTYTCGCNSGYTLDSNGNTCSDINECSSDSDNNCEQLCMNTDGSFTCGCNTGYTLHSNGYSCVDDNECTSGSHNCQQTCTNIAGTYTCGCNSGYTLDSNGNTCSDINECAGSDHGCEQICVNTEGTYSCSCEPGYVLRNNQRRCSDINECSSDANNNCEHSCMNTDGSFTCSCNPGYTLHSNGYSCVDENECASGSHNCQQECINTVGSFMCSCRTGYTLDNLTLTTCIDIDECASRSHGCQQRCVNTPGSFMCECNGGLILSSDGRSCQAGAPPRTPPTIISLHRASDTTAALSWIPPVASSGDVISYKVVYVQVDRDADSSGCSSVGPDRDGAPSIVVQGGGLEVVISELNPGEEFCLWVAGISIYGVGVFSEARRIPLFTNSPFQVLLLTNEICSTWLASNGDGKLYDITSSMSTLMGEMCDCSITNNHIVDERLLCNRDQSNSNEVVYQGRMVGLPSTSSEDMIQLLHTYATSKEASLTVQGQTVIIEPCLSEPSDSMAQCASPHSTTTGVTMGTGEPEERSSFPLIPVVAGAAGGGVLIVALILVLIGCGCSFCIASKKRGKTYNTHNLPAAPIEMKTRPKQLDSEANYSLGLYDDISDIKPTRNDCYIPAQPSTRDVYTAMGQMDEGNPYTTTKMDQYMYMASLDKKDSDTLEYYDEVAERDDVIENIYSLPRGETPLEYEAPMKARAAAGKSRRQMPLPPEPHSDQVESGYY